MPATVKSSLDSQTVMLLNAAATTIPQEALLVFFHILYDFTGAGCQRSFGSCWGARLTRHSRRAGAGAFTNATELAEAMYGPEATADNLAAASAAPADIPAVPIGSASAASVVAEAGVAPTATEPVAAEVAAAAVAPAEAVASGGN